LFSSQEIKFDEFLAAKTFCSSGTCPNLAEITLTGSEYVDEFALYQPQWSEGFKIPNKADLDTSVTLKGHSVDPIIPNTESPFDELDENLSNDEKSIDVKVTGEIVPLSHVLFKPNVFISTHVPRRYENPGDEDLMNMGFSREGSPICNRRSS